jgi:hypothetical protein
MPGPLSVTSIAASPDGVAATPTRTTLLAGVYLIALSSRMDQAQTNCRAVARRVDLSARVDPQALLSFLGQNPGRCP